MRSQLQEQLAIPLATSPWGEHSLVLCDRLLELGAPDSLVRPIRAHALSGASGVSDAQIAVHQSLERIYVTWQRDPVVSHQLERIVVRAVVLRNALVARDRSAPDGRTKLGQRLLRQRVQPPSPLEQCAGLLARRALGWWGNAPAFLDEQATIVAEKLLVDKHTRKPPDARWEPRPWRQAVDELWVLCRSLGWSAP